MYFLGCVRYSQCARLLAAVAELATINRDKGRYRCCEESKRLRRCCASRPFPPAKSRPITARNGRAADGRAPPPAGGTRSQARPPRPGWLAHGAASATSARRWPWASARARAPTPNGPGSPTSVHRSPHTQMSYGPNRTIDANYYSFAYTRLQEQDWAEFFVHPKKKHVDAAVGWMGYWYQGVGFRNPDAAWYRAWPTSRSTPTSRLPGSSRTFASHGRLVAELRLLREYDTYTLGRFRQLGEQLQLTVPGEIPISPWRCSRRFRHRPDGASTTARPPFYAAIVGLDLITYWNARAHLQESSTSDFTTTPVDADPNLVNSRTPGARPTGPPGRAPDGAGRARLNLRAP